MTDRLDEYRRRRDAARTPEPVPSASPTSPGPDADAARFVIQQHHARSLHWDLRLEHEGVLGVLGGADAACPAIRVATTSPCTPRTTRWSTSTSPARSPPVSTAAAG